jgi:hypothetical protein
MKTKLKIAAFYFLAFILSGCVPSLHPLFTEKDVVSDVNLVGIWKPADSNEIWEFKQTGKGYEGIYIDEKNKVGKFAICLVKLGDNLFFDIYPGEATLADNDFYRMHLVAAHSFMRVNLKRDSLELRVMNIEGLDKMLKSDSSIIQHERLENGSIVLTASTRQLQEFMLKYGIDEKYELFGKAKKAARLK